MPATLASLGGAATTAKKGPKKEGALGKIGGFLGLGTVARELGGIIPGLGQLATAWLPGGRPAGEVYSQAARGIGGSLLSTAATPFAVLGEDNPVERLGDKLLGANAVQDFYERAGDRGLLSALVEEVGNVSIGAGAAGSALRAGGSSAIKLSAASRAARAAEAAGMTAEAIGAAKAVGRSAGRLRPGLKEAGLKGVRARQVAKTARRAKGLSASPEALVRASKTLGRVEAAAHPYIAAARGTRQLTRAAEALNLAQTGTEGITPGLAPARVAEEGVMPRAVPAEAAAERAAAVPISPAAERLVGALPERGQQLLARGEQKLQARSVARVKRQREQLIDAEWRKMNQRGGAKAAREAEDLLVQRGLAPDHDVASAMVGDEIQSRLKGTAYVAGRAQEAVSTTEAETLAGISQVHRLPEEIRAEIEPLIQRAEAEFRGQASEKLQRLLGARRGREGLEQVGTPEADEVQLSGSQQARLDAIEREVNKAVGRADRQRGRDVVARARQVTAAQAEVDKVGAQIEILNDRATRARAAVMAELDIPDGVDPSGRSVAQLAGTLKPRRVSLPAGQARAPGFRQAETFAQETERSLLQRARRVQKRLDEAAQAEREASKRTKTLEKLSDARDQMVALFGETDLPADSALQRAVNRLGGRAQTVASQIELPVAARVAPHWKPLINAFDKAFQEALTNPALAAALVDVPRRLTELMRYATEQGLTPTHVSSMTPSAVERLLKGHTRIGGEDVAAAARRGRTLPETMTRSVDALRAAWHAVVLEAETGATIDFAERHSRPLELDEAGLPVLPHGWVEWDPNKTFARTTESISEEVRAAVAPGTRARRMVPEAIAKTLKNADKNYDHALFRGIRKVTDPWRTLVLTLSPRWYVNNVVGNFILSTAQGVSPAEWATAWQAHRAAAGAKPSRVLGALFGDADEKLSRVGTDVDTLIEGAVGPTIYEGLQGAERLADDALLKGARTRVRQVGQRLQRANSNVDEIGRLAVYINAKAKGYSDEVALQRASEVLVDYGDLGPLERGLVRSVVPFYAWQKGILKIAAKFPIDHPGRAAVLMQLGQLSEEMNAELPAAYQQLVTVPGIGDLNVRSMNPFADAASLTSPEGLSGSVNPFVEAIVRDVFDAPAEGYPERWRVDQFGRAMPDVDFTEQLTDIAVGLPAARLAGVSYGEGGLPALPAFAGLRTVTPERKEQLRERLIRSEGKAEEIGAPATRQRLRGAGIAAPEPERGRRARRRDLGLNLPEPPRFERPRLTALGQ